MKRIEERKDQCLTQENSVPEQPLKNLRWFDIGIITLIMFGEFIVRLQHKYIGVCPRFHSNQWDINKYSQWGAGYSSNFTLQIIPNLSDYISLIRHFDFKQLLIRLKYPLQPSFVAYSSLPFCSRRTFISSIKRRYNYFSPQVLAILTLDTRCWACSYFINFMAALHIASKWESVGFDLQDIMWTCLSQLSPM